LPPNGHHLDPHGVAGQGCRGDPRAHDPRARPGLNHSRHYTVAEANAALGWVQERIDRLRAAREGLGDEEARAALAEATPGNGGGQPGRVVSAAFLELRDALYELQAVEVVLRDL